MGRHEERTKAEPFEGQDIMYYIEKEIEEIKDDELTKGRIRSIFVQVNFGDKFPAEIAEYYDIPVKVVRGIAEGRLFSSITKDITQ